MRDIKVDLQSQFERFDDRFSPKIVGELNGQYVLLVKLEGDKVPWHIHDNEDEMFFIVEGELDILLEDRALTLKKDQFFIVRRGFKHKVIPKGVVKLMLFEPAEIKHTGSVESEITKSSYDRLI